MQVIGCLVSLPRRVSALAWELVITSLIVLLLWGMWLLLRRGSPGVQGEPVPSGGEKVSLTQLFWMFLLCAFVGDRIETLYVWLLTGEVVSRSSLIYGTFSVVWGLGGVLFTVALDPLRHRSGHVIFWGGFMIGGVYEYLCSIFTELIFGTVFWDYSHMPFHIRGRTNLLFMFFWGLLALVWVRVICPPVRRGLAKLPHLCETALTWCLAVAMALDMGLSGLVIRRYVDRTGGASGENGMEIFLDRHYPDELVERVWPDMEFVRVF